jgi:hypothetical protein
LTIRGGEVHITLGGGGSEKTQTTRKSKHPVLAAAVCAKGGTTVREERETEFKPNSRIPPTLNAHVPADWTKSAGSVHYGKGSGAALNDLDST